MLFARVIVAALLSCRPLTLGPALAKCDVLEQVNFFKDGTGNVRIELNCRDAREEIARHLRFSQNPTRFHAKMDSVAQALLACIGAEPIDKSIRKVSYDSLHAKLSVRFEFNDLNELNEALLSLGAEKHLYSLRGRTITRGPGVLFRGPLQQRKDQLPAAALYHPYFVRIGLPPGTRSIQCKDNPAAMLDKRNMEVILEADLNRPETAKRLGASITFETF